MSDVVADYASILCSDAPLIDTRAPVEFARGAFPRAVNLPLMSDDERRQVGTCYKRQGQEAAIALGHRLVSGARKAERMAAWVEFARAHPNGYLYCFRGGLRSQIVQRWLSEEAALPYPRIAGGYKAMRGYLLAALHEAALTDPLWVVGGMTGAGKTQLLQALPNGLDLEAYAHHRGSGFGQHLEPQATQIAFEHRLAIARLKARALGYHSFVVEDENGNIGSCSIPSAFYQRMQQAPMVWLEDTLENRVQRLLLTYVVDLHREFVAAYGEVKGMSAFGERLQSNLTRLHKRLGDQRYRRLAEIMAAALATQARTGDVSQHGEWIRELLADYYDPMYRHHLTHYGQRIEFSGGYAEVEAYLRARVS